MATDCLETTTISLLDAQQLRAQAVQLLHELVANRDGSDQRHLEAGKRDPLRLITGKSALDQAIASAQAMILNMDSVIANLTGEVTTATLSPSDPPIIETRSPDQRRSRFRKGLRTAINASFRKPPIPAVS